MNLTAAPDVWSRRRWHGVVSLIFILQLIVIFWLGQRLPRPPSQAPLSPAVRLVGAEAAELVALTDPTLFALPHVHGFSGPAWLSLEPLKGVQEAAALSKITEALPKAKVAYAYTLPEMPEIKLKTTPLYVLLEDLPWYSRGSIVTEESINRAGFKLSPDRTSFQPFAWTEPQHWLSLRPEQLGDAVQQFVSTNRFQSVDLTAQPQPELFVPELSLQPLFPTQSLVRVTGQLARRHLLTVPALPSWANNFILSNTLIQVAVNALGEASPVGPGRGTSGDKRADQFALSWARSAHFEPLPGVTQETWALHPLADLTFGGLVFQWHTVPLPDTNALAQKP